MHNCRRGFKLFDILFFNIMILPDAMRSYASLTLSNIAYYVHHLYNYLFFQIKMVVEIDCIYFSLHRCLF